MGLDTVELVLEFEEKFGVEIPNAIAETMVTPRVVRDFIVPEYQRLGRPADPEDIFERIRDITVHVSGITLDTAFVEDLGLD